jgi:hypothetical protein
LPSCYYRSCSGIARRAVRANEGPSTRCSTHRTLVLDIAGTTTPLLALRVTTATELLDMDLCWHTAGRKPPPNTSSGQCLCQGRPGFLLTSRRRGSITYLLPKVYIPVPCVPHLAAVAVRWQAGTYSFLKGSHPQGTASKSPTQWGTCRKVTC